MTRSSNASPSPLMVHQAAETVYLAWRKHVGEAEAREQAQAFARRFCISIDGPPSCGDLVCICGRIAWA